MSRKLGNFCIILGTVLLLGALSLYLHNRQDAEAARQASSAHLEQLVQVLNTSNQEVSAGETDDSDWLIHQVLPPKELLTEEDLQMTETIIDGHAYIGYLSMPTLNLELPILSSWDYPKLNIAPCRYYGTVLGENLVLMAHNYASHFGRISDLHQGDLVVFVDMDGHATRYEVVAQDILDPYAVEEMISGEFDLTLFTCTYGGKSRVTVYCDRVL